MKFCQQCGTQLPDDANVCSQCGVSTAEQVEQPVAAEAEAPIAESVEAEVTAQAAPAAGFNIESLKKLAPLGAAALAVIVVIAIVISLFSGGYKDPVKYYEQISNGNYKNVEKMAPKAVWEQLEEENDDFDLAELKEEAEESWEDTLEYLEEEYGKNIKIKIKVTDSKKLSDKKLDDLKDAIHDNYDEIAKKSITAAYELDVEMTIKGSEDEDDNETELISVKVGGKWYLCDNSGEFYTIY